MVTVITYGTFDLFHIGHVNLLRRLKQLGNQLVVGCSTDEFNKTKGKKSLIKYEHRVQVLKSCRYVDDVFPENSWDQKRGDVLKYGANIFAMGDDWVGKFNDLEDLCEVVYLPRTEDVSSTEIRQLVSSTYRDDINVIRSSVENLMKLVNRL